ncbi:MAG: ribosome biogenesis GTP-binding protein YihA/YsxC [Myxococcota bacterium]
MTPVVDPYRVREASFLRSSPSLGACGAVSAPEIAFLGRSNVGKSSLLGELLSRPKLVKTSRTPGRTRDVNLFSVSLKRVVGEDTSEADFIFADLPGYGYAKVSGDERQRMGGLLTDYLARREGLIAVVQLFDLRHAPSREDVAALDGLRQHDYELVLVATKADKLTRNQRGAARRQLASALGVAAGELVLFSTLEHTGRAEVWERLWRAPT